MSKINVTFDKDSFKFQIQGSEVQVIASDFLAICIASMGLDYEENLAIAGEKITAELYDHESDFYSEEYQKGSEKGDKFIKKITKLNDYLSESIESSRRSPGVRRRSTVLIKPETKEKAYLIGNKNVSAGIDIALEAFDISSIEEKKDTGERLITEKTHIMIKTHNKRKARLIGNKVISVGIDIAVEAYIL